MFLLSPFELERYWRYINILLFIYKGFSQGPSIGPMNYTAVNERSPIPHIKELAERHNVPG